MRNVPAPSAETKQLGGWLSPQGGAALELGGVLTAANPAPAALELGGVLTADLARVRLGLLLGRLRGGVRLRLRLGVGRQKTVPEDGWVSCAPLGLGCAPLGLGCGASRGWG